MNHKNGFNKLNKMTAHRKAMLRNMATVLFKHERIVTTKSKALEVRRTAEKMITRAKEDTVHNRRIVNEKIKDEAILAKLFTNIAPRMKERNGGYTRILKMGFRKQDAASMVILELVDYKLPEDKKNKAEEAKADKKAKREEGKADKKAKKAGEEKAAEKDVKAKAEKKVKKPAKAEKTPETAK